MTCRSMNGEPAALVCACTVSHHFPTPQYRYTAGDVIVDVVLRLTGVTASTEATGGVDESSDEAKSGAGGSDGAASSGTSAANKSLSALGKDVKLLDIGCGTSPLLFHLARTYGFRNLHGSDFSETAICFLKKHVEALRAGKRGGPRDSDDESSSDDEEGDSGDHAKLGGGPTTTDPAACIEYSVMDARDMSSLADGSMDIIVDKGCLDCFLNSADGWKDIRRYIDEVVRVLTPGASAVPHDAARSPNVALPEPPDSNDTDPPTTREPAPPTVPDASPDTATSAEDAPISRLPVA